MNFNSEILTAVIHEIVQHGIDHTCTIYEKLNTSSKSTCYYYIWIIESCWTTVLRNAQIWQVTIWSIGSQLTYEWHRADRLSSDMLVLHNLEFDPFTDSDFWPYEIGDFVEPYTIAEGEHWVSLNTDWYRYCWQDLAWVDGGVDGGVDVSGGRWVVGVRPWSCDFLLFLVSCCVWFQTGRREERMSCYVHISSEK